LSLPALATLQREEVEHEHGEEEDEVLDLGDGVETYPYIFNWAIAVSTG
jgi:hypothetical protein